MDLVLCDHDSCNSSYVKKLIVVLHTTYDGGGDDDDDDNDDDGDKKVSLKTFCLTQFSQFTMKYTLATNPQPN